MASPAGGLAALSLVEAALEAWADCQPEGYLLPERRAISLLFTLGAHLPGGEGNLSTRAQRLEALVFIPGDNKNDGALNLGAKDGKVHLLYFWRAYSEVARLVADAGPSQASDAMSASPAQGSVSELEQLRDRALELLEAADGKTIAASALAEALQNIAKTSAVPAFWKQVAASIGPDSTVQELGMQELTVLLLSWLHDVVMWQQAPGQTLQSDMLPALPEHDSEFCSAITIASADTAIGTLLPVTLQSLGQKGSSRQSSRPSSQQATRQSSRPTSQQTTLRPPLQAQPVRPPCSLMASGALLLDMEEQCRASGMLCVPDKARHFSRSAMCLNTPVGTPRSSLGATLLPETTPRSSLGATLLPDPALLAPSDKATSSGPPSPIRPPGQVSPDVLKPEGDPAPLPMENMRTAVMYLDTTPRISEPGEFEIPPGLPVSLHIYDVSQEASIRRINAFLANRKSPIKLGGVFHAAVEVDDVEWSYGCTTCQTSTGVTRNNPRADPNHHFRETVSLPPTTLSNYEVRELVAELEKEYMGRDYNLLRNNCCHFADDFCQRLGVGRIPAWVYRLARIGARIDSVLRPMQGLQGLHGSMASASTPSCSASHSPTLAVGGLSRQTEEAPLLT